MYHVKVIHPRNGSLIGYVGDVSESGLKILSDLPFVKDEHLPMHIQVCEGDAMQFDLAATCKWSGNNEENGYFEGGFCLTQPPANFAALVEALRNRRRDSDESAL